MKWVVFFGLVVAFTASFCVGLTDPRDVVAVNMLYLSLNSPPLLGWIPLGGDPCGEQWQGVNCVFSNVTTLNLNGMNLGGVLDHGLEFFASIIDIDLSNNHIGGSIPSNLPPTLKSLSLASNQLNGNIPHTLSSLTQLLNLSLNNNLVSGGIPDAFQLLTSLTNLDLSGNNLSGQLPPSMGNLSSLRSLHLQNNKLGGILDVLEDLPLQDLYIENNLFSGPIPMKLLNIPNFRKDGNPFNTTILSPPPIALPPSIATSPSSTESPWMQGNGPSAPETPKSKRSMEFFSTRRIIWIAISGAVVVIILGGCLLTSACCKKGRREEAPERHGVDAHNFHIEKPNRKSLSQQNNQEEKVPREPIVKFQDQFGLENKRVERQPKPQVKQEIDLKRMAKYSRHKIEHEIDMTGVDTASMPLQPPPRASPGIGVNKVIVNSNMPAEVCTSSCSTQSLKSCSVKVFTIAMLQQYTNSFSEDYFAGEGTLGSVYRAELPDGKLLAVKKLSSTASRQQTDKDFLQLVASISKIQHANVVELVGFCNEHGQRLLVYEYLETGTLHDALHVDGEIHENLSWNVRVQLALGAARALRYLHEVCQPPVVHLNFKSANILLDDKLAARVADSGLAPLNLSGFANQLSGLGAYGYTAPEFESGSYTCKSDVYSFGVVMLELLTGRKSYDRSRSRGEQSLVRWAIPQLHDIDALSRMVDPSLKGAYPVKSLSRFADIISRCVQWEPEFRPPISEIVQDLLHMI